MLQKIKNEKISSPSCAANLFREIMNDEYIEPKLIQVRFSVMKTNKDFTPAMKNEIEVLEKYPEIFTELSQLKNDKYYAKKLNNIGEKYSNILKENSATIGRLNLVVLDTLSKKDFNRYLDVLTSLKNRIIKTNV